MTRERGGVGGPLPALIGKTSRFKSRLDRGDKLAEIAAELQHIGR